MLEGYIVDYRMLRPPSGSMSTPKSPMSVFDF